MNEVDKNLGHATAYGYAKSKGYTGTEEEFAELMADYADVGQRAEAAATAAAASATAASGSASDSAASATAAEGFAGNASTAAGNASQAAQNASQSATAAAGSATAAGQSATAAANSATTAGDKATQAAQSATAAAGSATTAGTAATAAQTAQTAAETAQGKAEDAQAAAEAAAQTLVIDPTLTQPNQAAEAKATGDAISLVKSHLEVAVDNLDNGKVSIANTFKFGTLNTSGELVSFDNNSRSTGVEYYTAKDGDILTLDDGFSMILCEYDASKTLLNRGVKLPGEYALTSGHLYRLTVFDPNGTIQSTPYQYAYKAHLQSAIDKKIDGVQVDVNETAHAVENLQLAQILNVSAPDATYHNNGYVNATTNVITSIAATAGYFYSDLIHVNAGDIVTVKYRDTLDVVWILSAWTDANTFSSGILKGNSNSGEQEYSFTASADMYIRHSARYLNNLVIKSVNAENLGILDNALSKDDEDYGFLLNSFLKIGAVGDSLASGECISGTPSSSAVNDLYEHSWLQYMARFYGFEGVNFSKGGMTTRGWLFDDDYNQQGWTKAQIPGNKCNAYIIGIGANDMGFILEDSNYLGTPSDIGTTNPTFYRYYAQIISNLKTIQPKAKFFLFTLTWLYTETAPYDSIVDDVNAAITYIAEHTENCYLINLDEDRWYYGIDNTGNKRSGHYNAIGYNMQGMHLAKLIGNYMHSHQDAFRQIEFIGTNLEWSDN